MLQTSDQLFLPLEILACILEFWWFKPLFNDTECTFQKTTKRCSSWSNTMYWLRQHGTDRERHFFHAKRACCPPYLSLLLDNMTMTPILPVRVAPISHLNIAVFASSTTTFTFWKTTLCKWNLVSACFERHNIEIYLYVWYWCSIYVAINKHILKFALKKML